MLVGTNVCVCVDFVWEETHLSDLMTNYHLTCNARYRTRVAAVRGEHFTTAPVGHVCL